MTDHKIAHENALQYMFAGKAVVTLKNEKSGNRFTYKITISPNKKRSDRGFTRWVKVLTGPDNVSHYQFIGAVRYREGMFVFNYYSSSKISRSAQSVKVFDYIVKKLNAETLEDFISIYHDSKCGKCRKQLTTPLSVKVGLGPYCAGMIYKSNEVTRLMLNEQLEHAEILLAHDDPGVRQIAQFLLKQAMNN